MKHKKYGWIFLFILSLCLTGCQPATPASKQDFVLNTIATVTIYPSDGRSQAILDECFAMIRRYENLLSRTIPGSDVYKLNHAGGQPVAVNPETYALVETALAISRETNGVYDLTVSPVVDLWRFDSEQPRLPDENMLQERLASVSWQNVVMESGNVISLKNNAQIDLGSIAKGYIADKIAAYLKEQNIGGGLIDLGGNILTIGLKPDGGKWKVGVRQPFKDRKDIVGYVEADSLSVVSSGVYERYFILEDKLYHHLLNTATGYPEDNDLDAVTLFSSSSALGDAYATACFLSGLEGGMALVEKHPELEAIFITKDGTLHYSSGIGESILFKTAGT